MRQASETGAALKALLVDLDGTLVHSADAQAAACAAALLDHGIPADPARLAAQVDGRGWHELLPLLTADHPTVAPAEVAQRQRALYPAFFHLLRVNQPVADLVRLLHGTLATALVTTAPNAEAEAVLDHLELTGLFDLVITGDHVLQQKPAPEGYAMAALLLHARPEECLVIEHSEAGMEAGLAFCDGVLRWAEPHADVPGLGAPQGFRSLARSLARTLDRSPGGPAARGH